MAADAVARRAPEHVVDVAVRAREGRVLAHQHKHVAVVEARAWPLRIRRPVAGLTRRPKPGRRVRRVLRRVVRRQMAADAIARRAPEHVVDVAVRARQGRVLAHQRKHVAVTEAGTGKLRIRRPVARLTRRPKPGRRVRRVLRRVVRRQMAADAIARRAPEHVVDVAVRACEGRVLAHQRKHVAVTEAGTGKLRIRRPVARLTRRPKPGRRVRRVLRRVVRRQMAADAVARRAPEHVVDVAVRARQGRVLAHQRKHVAVTEAGTGKLRIRRPVARLTRRPKPGRRVRRVLRRVVRRQMAADAIARRAPVDVVLVAARARERGVRAHEGERAVVIEAHARHCESVGRCTSHTSSQTRLPRATGSAWRCTASGGS